MLKERCQPEDFTFYLFMAGPRALSVGDISKETGLTRQRIWQLAVAGRIPAERANPGEKHHRFHDSALFAAWRKEKARQSARPRASQARRAYRISQRRPEKIEKLPEICINQTEVSASDKESANGLAVRRSLLTEAKRAIAELAGAEGRLLSTRNEILERAWQLGKTLTALKEQVGRGNWYLWLDANLPELGSTERARQANAARCMRLYRDNSDRRNSCGRLSVESVRKFMWGYIPAKERLQHEGDFPIEPLAHYLNFVNDFWMWDSRVRIGKYDAPDLEELRFYVAPVVRRLIELCGHEWIRTLLKGCPPIQKLRRKLNNLL